MYSSGKRPGVSGSSIGSAASTATAKSSTNRAAQQSQRNNQYDSNPVTAGDIDDAHKLFYMIKASQIQTDMDKMGEDIDELKEKLRSAKDFRGKALRMKTSAREHSNALKKLYLAKELVFIAETLYSLISKYSDQIDRARIRLSDDSFASIKVLVDRFRNVMKNCPDIKQLKVQLEAAKQQNIGSNVPRFCLNRDFMEGPKTVVKECDHYRSEIRQLRQNIAVLKAVHSEVLS